MFEAASTAELTDAIGQLHGMMTAAQRHLLAAIAECERREAWVEDGSRSMADWVAARLSVPVRTARETVRVAQALPGLPMIDGALGRGELSFDQVAALTHIAEPDTEAELIEEAKQLSLRQLQSFVQLRRPNRVEAARADRRRELRFREDPRDDQMGQLFGRLRHDEMATLVTAVDRLAEQAPRDPVTGEYEPLWRRRADALVALARATLAADADLNRATVVIHTDLATVAGEDEGMGETDDGAPLSTETVRRLACGARWYELIEGPDGCVKVGRATRTPPPWMVRRIRRRDRGCRFAGCSAQLGIEIHHIVHWGNGGDTDEPNLVSLCPRHHHLVHEEGWSIRGDPSKGIEFVRPDGRVLATGPPGLREDIAQRLFGGEAA